MAAAQQAYEQGDFERGLRCYSKVLEFNPENTQAWSGQVRMLIELGEFAEAKLWADKALERFPRDPELLAAKAVTLARQGNLSNAMAFSDASFEERGDTPYIWLARADVLLARAEPRADYCFDKALSLAPRNWFFRWLAARIHFFYRQFVLALKRTKEGLAEDASCAVLWVQMALCQRELGLLGPAGDSLNRALELEPRIAGAGELMQMIHRAGSLHVIRGWFRRFSFK